MTIAVYIPSYNQKTYLREAIESVLAQTRPADQIIVVDDASSDGSVEMIRGYASRYPGLFTTVFHEQNQGVARTRIDALRAVTCDLVTYIDGDDVMAPEKLETEQRTLAHSDAQIVFSNYGYMSEDGRQKGRKWVSADSPPEGDVFVETVSRRFPRGTLFHNELLPIHCLREVGFHDPWLSTFEDYDLRIRLTRRFRTAYCPHVSVWVREHAGPRLSKSSCEEHFRNVLRIAEKNRPLWSDLPEDQVRRIEAGLNKFLATLARRSAAQLIREGQRTRARAAWREARRRGACPLQLATDLLVSTLPEWVREDILPFVKANLRRGRGAAGRALRGVRRRREEGGT